MAKRVVRDFGDMPVVLRQAILAFLSNLEEKDVDRLVITGIQPPRCGSEKPRGPARTHHDPDTRAGRDDDEHDPTHRLDGVRDDRWAV